MAYSTKCETTVQWNPINTVMNVIAWILYYYYYYYYYYYHYVFIFMLVDLFAPFLLQA